MYIEAVTTCVNYADFLAHSLPDNLQHLDRLVVVTSPEDKDTQRLCAKYGVDCIETEAFKDGGDAINKGLAIQIGLSHLRHKDWLLHLDADIVLPHRFRNMLDHSRLDSAFLYGADRLNTKSYDHWMKHKEKTIPQHHWRYMVHAAKEFSLGSRLVHQEFGYLPCGYFQLWHASTHRRYPIISGSAEHSDAVFANQWPRRYRALLPEFFVYHLESDETAPFGANWKGRTTKPFGPKS